MIYSALFIHAESKLDNCTVTCIGKGIMYIPESETWHYLFIHAVGIAVASIVLITIIILLFALIILYRVCIIKRRQKNRYTQLYILTASSTCACVKVNCFVP